ncbi:MAG: phytoene/squalene synthase family protein [Chthoniobacterales bacterium]
MKVPAEKSLVDLRTDILRAVSRSFYLSIRMLPAGLRDPVALAYLLARATDTIADTAAVSTTVRAEQLRNLAQAIAGDEPWTQSDRSLAGIFGPQQTDASERVLLEAVPQLLKWLASLQDEDRCDVRGVLQKISQGQLLDIEHFTPPGAVRAFATADQLERYTYLVAGSVGEFWTQICSRHLAPFADRPDEEMCQLGIAYGKGLQLINILRDLGTDLRNGRCYLPADQLAAIGVEPDAFLDEPAQADSVLAHWRAKAADGVAAGIEYACAVGNRRVRFATALPALIGARTLALLRAAGTEFVATKVKVPRREVQAIVSSGAITLGSRRGIRRLFSRLSQPVSQRK